MASGFLLLLGKLSDCKKNRKRVGTLPAKVWWEPADPQFCSSHSRTRSLDLLLRGHSTPTSQNSALLRQEALLDIFSGAALDYLP